MAVSLQGFEELDRRFKALALVAQRQVLAKAVKAAAAPVRQEMSSLAPHGDSGDLASGISIQAPRDADVSEARVQIGPSKSEFYGYYVEFGTGRTFDAAAARAMGYPGVGSGKGATRAEPFARPALENKQPEAEAKMIEVLGREISKAERA